MRIPNTRADQGVPYKAIGVHTLYSLLGELPASTKVGVNNVGNLVVWDRDWRYLGYVDLIDEEYVDVAKDEE